MPHFQTFQNVFKKFSQAGLETDLQSVYKLENKNSQDSDNNLIEKHALLDVLLETQFWKFKKNEFLYLKKDGKDQILS